MAKDYGKLWKSITRASDENKAIRILAEILLDKEGRDFALKLERSDAEICIEILDNVRAMAFIPYSSSSRIVVSGHRGTRPQICGETGVLCHVEETRGKPQ